VSGVPVGGFLWDSKPIQIAPLRGLRPWIGDVYAIWCYRHWGAADWQSSCNRQSNRLQTFAQETKGW